MMTLRINDYDVVVVGGGSSGVAAAIAAARGGARTAIVEGTSAFGGMATTGLVPTFSSFTDREEVIVRGIGLEILEKLLQCGGAVPKPDPRPGEIPPYDWARIDAEKLKLLLDQLLVEANVQVRLFTMATEPVMDGGRIAAVQTWSKSGQEQWRAKAFVDATGDADMAARAGCPFDKGDETGLMQPSTLCFLISGLREAYGKDLRTNPFATLVKQASLAGELTGRHDHLCVNGVRATHSAGFNYKHQLDTDGTDADSLTHAVMEGRRMAHELCDYLRRKAPGCKDAFVATTANLLGIRETRRIVGEYVMDGQHYFECRKSDEDIGNYAAEVDIHVAGRDLDQIKARRHPHSDKTLPAGRHYGIPYRALVPKGVTNLLVAGRAVSSDRAVQGSIRQMPAAFVTGQAAGVAAALAARNDGAVRNVDVRQLQDALIGQGAYIDRSGPE
jgi:hypothetical protein